MTDSFPSILLEYLLTKCGLEGFPIHSINKEGHCTCKKGVACTASGKHPYLNLKWKTIATNSIDKFKNWSSKKEINYAICTGRLSSKTNKFLIVVDIDVKEHEILNSLPKTFCYQTGSGGYHYWFWSSEPLKNSVSQLADKVDIRGTGGYVIIPPSKHISGQEYKLLCKETQEIADLPIEIFNTLKTRERNMPEKKVSASRKKVQPKISMDEETALKFKTWSKESIPSLRQRIQSGSLIPLGVRNIVLHRLLSSDRAKGIAKYEDLFSLGETYLALMENKETFDLRELRNVVCSVMRYPIYNNDEKSVNKNYAIWMLKNKKKEIDSKKLESLDENFFGELKKTHSAGISLNLLAQVRKEWYHANGMKEGFATYRPQLLAKKLKDLGFSRTRSSSRNLWNIDTSGLSFNTSFETQEKENEIMTLSMTDQVAVSEPASDSSATPAEELAPLGPDGNPLTFVEEREDVIKTKAKYHPSDSKYVGKESSQEGMMRRINFFNELSDEQKEAYRNNSLILDEERTRGFMGAIEVDDVVGIKGNMYKISSVSEDEIAGYPRKLSSRKFEYSMDEKRFTLQEMDMALNLERAEILYRNEKPFGVEEEMEYKVKLKVYADSHGRTYVFKSGKQVVKGADSEKK